MPNGVLQASQIITYMDSRSTVFEPAAAFLGIGLPSESGTLALLELTSQKTILGDGATLYGIGNQLLQQKISADLITAGMSERYDVLFSRQSNLMLALQSNITGNLPSGWKFTNQNLFDAHLQRLNGGLGAPTTPALVGVSTAVSNINGALPNTLVGNAPYIVHTLVGSSDQAESLPTGVSTQVAISGANNAYSYQIVGTVPAGVTKVRTYRTVFGGSSAGPYYWDQDVAVTAGSAYPAILILQNDGQLRTDWLPPSWMQCALRPSSAGLFALAYSVVQPGGASSSPMKFNAYNMLSPGNVLLLPVNKFLGVGNQPQTGIFGSSIATAANTATFTPGSIQTSNNALTNVQGFAGATGIQCRCTTTFVGTLTPTISYTYFDATHGWGNPQTVSGVVATSAFNNSAVGATITFTIPAGRIVQTVTESSVSGTATSGAYLYEGVFPR
jgi:hypothetical protein